VGVCIMLPELLVKVGVVVRIVSQLLACNLGGHRLRSYCGGECCEVSTG